MPQKGGGDADKTHFNPSVAQMCFVLLIPYRQMNTTQNPTVA